jgi:hypothetical protein
MSNSIAESLLNLLYLVSFTLWISAWRAMHLWAWFKYTTDAHRVTIDLKLKFRAILLRRSSLENRLSDTRHSVRAQVCTGMHMISCGSLVATSERSAQDPGHRNQPDFDLRSSAAGLSRTVITEDAFNTSPRIISGAP